MKKQLYLLAVILMFFLGFYSVYYYSNYRVKNFPVRASFEKLDSTRLVSEPFGDTLSHQNLLYSPALNKAFRLLQDSLSGEVKDTFNGSMDSVKLNNGSIPNENLVIHTGKYTDSTLAKIKGLENKWFQNNFTFDPGVRKGEFLAFAHCYMKVIFKNNFRHFSPGLIFKGQKVKALEYLPSRKSSGSYELTVFKDTGGTRILEIDTKKGQLVYAFPSSKKSLYKAYSDVHRIIGNNKGRQTNNVEQLVIPALDFQLTGQLNYMENRMATIHDKEVNAFQRMTLSLNAEFNALQPRGAKVIKSKIRFNKPFLLYFKREEAGFPYILAWIGNPEVLLSKARGRS